MPTSERTVTPAGQHKREGLTEEPRENVAELFELVGDLANLLL